MYYFPDSLRSKQPGKDLCSICIHASIVEAVNDGPARGYWSRWESVQYKRNEDMEGRTGGPQDQGCDGTRGWEISFNQEMFDQQACSKSPFSSVPTKSFLPCHSWHCIHTGVYTTVSEAVSYWLMDALIKFLQPVLQSQSEKKREDLTEKRKNLTEILLTSVW